MVRDLVLQDADEPGARGRLAIEPLQASVRGQQGVLNHVPRQIAVAQSAEGIAEQIIAMVSNPCFEVLVVARHGGILSAYEIESIDMPSGICVGQIGLFLLVKLACVRSHLGAHDWPNTAGRHIAAECRFELH